MPKKNTQADLNSVLLNLDEETLQALTPFLSDVAPNLVSSSGSRFASKELNVGRGAVTGGRAFRDARVRSKSAEEQAAEAARIQGLNNGFAPQQSWRTDVGRGEVSNRSDAVASGRASELGRTFGLGIGANIAKNLALTGGTGLGIGASAGQIAGAVPGAIAGAVKGGMVGPVGAGLNALGMADAISSPIGVANTIGGLVGGLYSADVAERRSSDFLSEVSGSPEVSPGVRAAMERAAAPPAGLGLLGLLGEAALSSVGDLTGLFDTMSPIEQAELAGAKQASIERFSGSELGLFKDPEQTTGIMDQAMDALGGAMNRGLESIGGYGSKQAAIDAGFSYDVNDRGQISISPPSMLGPGGYYDRKAQERKEKDRLNSRFDIGDNGDGSEGRGAGFDSPGGLAGAGGWGGPRGGYGGGYGF